MSRPRPQEVTCTQCGNTESVTVWDSLSAVDNPKEKDQLIDGSLFTYKCSNCGSVGVLNYAMLFMDDERHMMVYYCPDASEISNVEDMLTKIEETMSEVGVEYRCRIVASLNSLREKAAICDDDLDDRAVEVAKAVFKAYAGASDELAGHKVTSIYYSGLDDDGNLILYLILDSGVTQDGTIPLAFYEKIEDQCVLGPHKVDDSFFVDEGWAEDWIDSSGVFKE